MGEDIQNIHRVSNVIRGTPWIVQMIKNNSQMSKKNSSNEQKNSSNEQKNSSNEEKNSSNYS